MLKLTGGEHKGRPLKWLDTPTIRPTPARVREAIFNILAAELEASRWWDLCCGSGVVGLEALSRGAASVVFVDQNKRSLDLLKANLRTLGIDKQAKVLGLELLRMLKQQPVIDAEFIYCDPPYESPIYQPLLDRLGEMPLAEGIETVTLVLEHRRGKPPWQDQGPWVTLDQRQYGDTSLVILERSSAASLSDEMIGADETP